MAFMVARRSTSPPAPIAPTPTGRRGSRPPRTPSVDPQAQALLVSLLDDITRLLGTSAVKPVEAADDAPLTERLDGLAVQFEAEHPALSTALRRVVDALGKAGI